MKIACVITGHRPTRFWFKYQEKYDMCKKIKNTMREQFIKLYEEEGVRRFYIGGSLGVDLWAGEIVMRLKEIPEYSEIELAVVLPFPGHDARWDEKSRRRLRFLLRHSAEQITIGEEECPRNYVKRNCYMVEHSWYMVAVYDNDRSRFPNAIQPVDYALKLDRHIILIHPDTAEVSVLLE